MSFDSKVLPAEADAIAPDVLTAVAVTMPPWPGEREAVLALGPWSPTVAPGAGLAPDDSPLTG